MNRRIINQLIEDGSSLATGATAGYLISNGQWTFGLWILVISMLNLRAGQIQVLHLIDKHIDDWFDN